MINLGFKKYYPYFLASIIVCLLSSLVSSLTFSNRASEFEAQAESIMLPYESFEIDYIVNGSSTEQINEFSKSKYVKSVTPFYKTLIDFNFDDKELEQTLIWTDGKIEFTEFVSDRLVESISDDNHEYPLYLDYGFASKHDISLGNKLNYSGTDFYVTRLYQSYDRNLCYCPTYDAFKKSQNQEIKYSSSYIKCNDRDKFYNQKLKDYIPMNELLPKNDYQTEEEYNQYLDDFMNGNYKNRIVKIYDSYENDLSTSNELKTLSDKYSLYSMIFSVLMIMICAICILLIPYKKISYEFVLGNKKQVQYRYLIINLTCLILFSLVFLLGVGLFKGVSYYCSFKNAFNVNLLPFVSSLIAYIVMEFISFIVIKGKKLKKVEKEIIKKE